MGSNSEFVATIPREAGCVRGITEYKGQVIIACANGVYYLKEEVKYVQETRIVVRRYLEPVAACEPQSHCTPAVPFR